MGLGRRGWRASGLLPLAAIWGSRGTAGLGRKLESHGGGGKEEGRGEKEARSQGVEKRDVSGT